MMIISIFSLMHPYCHAAADAAPLMSRHCHAADAAAAIIFDAAISRHCCHAII
jgi:hypothetical protein